MLSLHSEFERSEHIEAPWHGISAAVFIEIERTIASDTGKDDIKTDKESWKAIIHLPRKRKSIINHESIEEVVAHTVVNETEFNAWKMVSVAYFS